MDPSASEYVIGLLWGAVAGLWAFWIGWAAWSLATDAREWWHGKMRLKQADELADRLNPETARLFVDRCNRIRAASQSLALTTDEAATSLRRLASFNARYRRASPMTRSM